MDLTITLFPPGGAADVTVESSGNEVYLRDMTGSELTAADRNDIVRLVGRVTNFGSCTGAGYCLTVTHGGVTSIVHSRELQPPVALFGCISVVAPALVVSDRDISGGSVWPPQWMTGASSPRSPSGPSCT